jgi:predicted ATPase
MLIRGNVGEDSVSFDGVVTTPDGTKPEPWKWPGPPPKPSLASRPISRLLWPCVLLRFRSEELAAPSDVTEGEPRIDYDGYGLASLLAYLANNDPGRLERLVKGVAELVPGVLRTRQKAVTRPGLPTEGERAERILQYQFEVEMEGLGWIRADMLSEGTLFAFGMHAVLEQPIPPQLVLVDDIDRGLHPRAQRTLIRQLKELAEKKHVCLVVTTHSPYVLDELPAEAVRVVRSCGEAGTRVRPLTEHPDWAEWKENMTGGEFWAFVGEDWLETPS